MTFLNRTFAAVSLLCIFATGTSAFSPQPEPVLRYLGPDEGFGHTNVTSMYQDATGALWVEGLRGVSRYRGVVPEEKVAGLDSILTRPACMRGIFGEKDGKVWFNVRNNILGYDIRTESWHLVFPENSLKGDIAAADIRDGIIYAAVPGTLLKCFPDGRIVSVVLPSFFGGRVSSMLVSSSGKVFFGTISSGLHSMDENGGIRKEADLDSRVNSLYEDSAGNLWICTRGEGLLRLSPDGELSSYTRAGSGLSDDYVRCVCEDDCGRIWIGMMLGLDCLDPVTGKVIRISDVSGSYGGVRNLTIDCMLKDGHGTIWLGSYYAGLSYFNPDNVQFRISHIGSLDRTVTVISDMVSGSGGRIFGGTSDKGLFVHDPVSGRTRYWNTDNSGIPGDNVKSLVYDSRSGELWFSMFVGGVAVLDPSSGRIGRISLPQHDDSFETADISCRLCRVGDTIYAATYAGVYAIDMHSRRADRILNRSRVFDIAAEEDGTLYVVTEQNCFEVWKHDGEGKYVRTMMKVMDDNLVNRIRKDSKGRVWLATIRSGAVMFDPGDNSMTAFSKASCGLESDLVSDVAELSCGMMLLGTSAGLTLLDPDSFRTENFNSDTGFPLTSLDEGCLWSGGGSVACGGMNGIVTFAEENITRPSDGFSVYFASLSADGKTVSAGDCTGILSQALPYTESITIGHGYDMLDFRVGADISEDFNPADFQYTLDGFDKEWHPLESGTIRYMNLRPGKYTLTLRPRSDKLNAGPEPVSLQIRVRPPFYGTATAFVFYVLVIMAGTAGALHIRYSRKQLLQSLEMERIEKKRQEEITQWKLSFFTNISHEFRTPLTMIIGQLDVVLREKLPGKAGALVSSARRNAVKLKELVDELIDFRRQEQGRLTLKVSRRDLCGYVSDLCSDFAEYAEIREIAFGCSVPQSPVFAVFDPVQLQKVLNNLISNAFRHTQSGGKIDVRLNRDGDCAVISVTDTGDGIPASMLADIFKSFVHYSSTPYDNGTGIGLALTKSIVELHHGTISVSSEVGTGSTFTVKLPCNPDFSADTNVEAVAPEEYVKTEPVAGILHPHEDMEADSSLPVLLAVEDDPGLRELFISVFSPYWNVEVASDGVEGLKMAKELQPDLVLSDVMMPGMSGTEMCMRLKDDFATSHIPVVLLTALSSSENMVSGLKCGADDYVTKPFDADVLVAKCNAIYRNRRLIQKKYTSTAFGPADASSSVKDGIPDLPESVSVNRKDAEFVRSVMELIKENMDKENIGVDFLCRELGMSRTALFSKIKGVFGHTPTELIQNIRLNEACRLLKTCPDMKIAAVADAVGINSVQYLGKLFKSRFGVTPSEYRNYSGRNSL